MRSDIVSGMEDWVSGAAGEGFSAQLVTTIAAARAAIAIIAPRIFCSVRASIALLLNLVWVGTLLPKVAGILTISTLLDGKSSGIDDAFITLS
jgi:hypothetical protein